MGLASGGVAVIDVPRCRYTVRVVGVLDVDRENAVDFVLRGNSEHDSGREGLAEAFVIDEKKSLSFDDRAAEVQRRTGCG